MKGNPTLRWALPRRFKTIKYKNHILTVDTWSIEQKLEYERVVAMYSNQRKGNPMMMRGKSATVAAFVLFGMVVVGMIISIAGQLT